MEEKRQLTELQIKILQMMKWFHQFCVENDIAYYMVGGTMLGAARHQGFIPWDDDIDVGVPRKHYDKLIMLGKSIDSENNKFRIESHYDGNDDYEYPYAKIYDTTTTLIENKRKHPKRGVYIDVFPLDGIGDSLNSALNNYKPILLKLDLLNAKICDVREGRSRLKNTAVRIAGLIPDCIYNPRRLIKQLDRLCSERDFYDSRYVGNLVGNWGKKEIMPFSAFGTPTLYSFEDLELYGVEDYEQYLSYLYGEWRELPPIDKQKSHHDFEEINLSKSYLEKTWLDE